MRENRAMDQNTAPSLPGQVVSMRRVVRRVPLAELVERAAEARAERTGPSFNSSV